MEPVVNRMAALLAQVGSFVTAAIGWMGSVVGAITAEGNEILLIGFIMGISGFAVGLFKRLTRIS